MKVKTHVKAGPMSSAFTPRVRISYGNTGGSAQ